MMKTLLGVAAVLGGLCWPGWVAAEEAAEKPKSNELDRFARAIDAVVKQYYPEATISVTYDKELKADKIHFQYNTQIILMRFQNKDGSWQEPRKVIGPYVGGIWCDIVLEKGRYDGDTEGAEQGATQAGSEFYSYLVTPYSKQQDRHIAAKLRYPGGTPPAFLREFSEMMKSFEQYVAAPDEQKKAGTEE